MQDKESIPYKPSSSGVLDILCPLLKEGFFI
jgi:hypothetical protein